MLVRLLVAGRGAEQHGLAIEVEVDPDHRTADLIAALATAGLDPQTSWCVERTGLALSSTARAGDLDLRSGDRLIDIRDVRRTGAARLAATPRIAVAGGEGTGRHTLLDGPILVGRGVGDLPLTDTLVSREHCRITPGTVTPPSAQVEDLHSQNGTFVDRAPVTAPRSVAPGELIEVGRTLLRLAAPEPVAAQHALGPVAVHRPPRRRTPQVTVQLELSMPPAPSARPGIPFAASLLPLVAAGVLAVFFGPRMLAFAILAPLIAIGTHWEEGRRGKKESGRGTERFEAEADQAVARLAAAAVAETALRRELHPDLAEVADRCRRLAPPLWHRRPSDDDFLAVRLGSADQPGGSTLRIEGSDDSPVRARADELRDLVTTLPSVPVVATLPEIGAIAIAGQRELVVAAAGAALIELAAQQSPEDVALVVCSSEFGWATWLPHTSPAWWPTDRDATPGELLQLVADTVTARTESARTSTGNLPPRIVVVADEESRLPAALAGAILKDGRAVGVYAIWLASSPHRVPGECGAVLDVSHLEAPTVAFPQRGVVVADVVPDLADPGVVEQAARDLAGAVDVGAGGGLAAIPSSVALPSLLGLTSIDAAAVAARWDARPPGVRAPLGLGLGGEPVQFDIRADGPHALVGGTTGAGKSELLQTLVASLSATYPPDRITFVLVDYKGGAAFKDCIHLPHVVGFVTDLDGGLVRRALVSLNAELRRREHLLKDMGARDILDMEARHPDLAPPVLLLVIDEFAALARELPAFVEGVVDVAQRGRSLGIHLVLATQRPTGVINDNIRSNTNLRLALRMNDRNDSADVIGKPDAAVLPRSLPGRAYLRTGEGELAPLQVAYAGGVTEVSGASIPRVRRLATPSSPSTSVSLPTSGSLAPSVPSVPSAEKATDLQRLVTAIGEAFTASGVEPPRPPWLPALPPMLSAADLPTPEALTATAVGLVDRPALQRQDAHTLDLATVGGLLVVGGARSGKSTLLRTVASGWASRLSPAQLRTYVLDCSGGGGWSGFEALPHCAGVVAGGDQERTTKLFAVLERAVAQRKADGFDPATQPRLLLLLDGYSGFVAAYEKVDHGVLIDKLPRLIADGRSLGLTVAVTADRRGAIPPAVYSALETRLVLRLSDPDEYGALGLDGQVMREITLQPGQALLPDTTVMQLAVGDPSAAIAAFADGPRVQALGVLPERGALAPYLRRGRPLEPVVAVEELELAPVSISLAHGHVLVAGPPRTGRSTALGAIAAGLRSADPELALHLIAPRRSPLTALQVWTSMARGRDAAEDLAASLEDALAARTEDSPPLVVVVDDGEELRDSATDSSLLSLARRGRDLGVRIVVAVDNGQAHRLYGGLVPEVRRDRAGLLLSPAVDVDGDLVGVNLPRRALRWPAGRAYLVSRGTLTIVQVLIDEAAE